MLNKTNNANSSIKLLVLSLYKFQAVTKQIDRKDNNEMFQKSFNELLNTLNLLVNNHEYESEETLLNHLRELISTRNVFMINDTPKISTIDQFNKSLLEALVNFISKKCSKKYLFFSKATNPLLDIMLACKATYESYISCLIDPMAQNSGKAEVNFILGNYQSAIELLVVKGSNITSLMGDIDFKFASLILQVCQGYTHLEAAKKASTASKIKAAEDKMILFWDEMTFKESPKLFSHHFPKIAEEFCSVKVNYLLSLFQKTYPRNFDSKNLKNTTGSVMSMKNFLRELLDLPIGLGVDKQLGLTVDRIQLADIEPEAKEFLSDHKVKDIFYPLILSEINDILRSMNPASNQELSYKDRKELNSFKSQLEEKLEMSINMNDNSIQYLGRRY